MPDAIYADLLFLVNFSMDFLCFYLCARLLHKPLSLWRGMLASALGGVYAVAVLFLTVGKVLAFVLDIAVCLALCACAFAAKGERFRSILRLTGVYLLVSMLLGGVMTALFEQLNRIPGLTENIEEDGLFTWVFLGLALVSAWLTSLWGRCFRRVARHQRVTVIIEQEGRRAELSGIVDSGNLLRDPISGKVVIPSNAKQLYGVAPSHLLRAATAVRVSDAIEDLPSSLMRQVRLIPARGATGERLLIGWCPEHIYLRNENEQTEREVSALIAPTKLSEKRDGIAALVPSELILL